MISKRKPISMLRGVVKKTKPFIEKEQGSHNKVNDEVVFSIRVRNDESPSSNVLPP